jgi:hypothetical protein
MNLIIGAGLLCLGAMCGLLMMALVVAGKMADKDSELIVLEDKLKKAQTEAEIHAKECKNIAKAGKKRGAVTGANA